MMEAHQFNPKSLVQISCEDLIDHLCRENCIGLWQFTNACNMPTILNLQYEAFRFICEDFEEVSLSEEFLQLAVQELADILGRDDFTVTPESTVYESLLRWINYMPEERQGAIATLLPKVRLGLMDKRYITDNVLSNDVVKTNHESNLLVLNTLQVMSEPLLLSELGIDITLFCPRLPNAVLLIVGFSKTIEAFDYSTNNWITVHTHPTLKDLMTRLHFHSTVFLGEYLYIVGGGLRLLGPLNRVWRFNLITHTWKELSLMQESRGFMGVTELKGCIYAMGGCSHHIPLRTAERYQPDINQWMFIASMNAERIRPSCTTLNNKIYICGGQSNGILNTAEYYEPDTNQWTKIAPMGRPRCGPGVVAYMGHIFAVGGRDDYKDLRSAEAYNPVTNTWHDVPKTVHRHKDFGIAVMNKKIFVVSCNENKIIECYDYTTNTWSVEFDMNHHYNIVSCSVISGLPNMAEYYSPRDPVIPSTQS